MTMQPVSSNGGRRPYQPKTVIGKGKSGNYHRIHQAVLEKAGPDGVFSTTEVIKEIQKKVKAGYSSVASTVFQWSDPTEERGVRRVRIHTPRVKASDPPETQVTKTPATTTTTKVTASFPPETNKNGPFYLVPGQWPSSGLTRKEEVINEMRRIAKTFDHKNGWLLIDMVKIMADLGFNSASVYKAVKEEVRDGNIEKRGSRRRFKGTTVRIDPLSDPNSFKGPKTQKMIDEERGLNTEAANDVRAEGVERTAELDVLVTQMVQKKLEQPEMLSLIDAFVKARIEEALRRQLGM